MEASGSWDAIDWNQIEDPRSRRSSQGMEEFLLEDEEVYAQGHGVNLLNTDEAGIVSVTNFRLLFVGQATKSIIELGTIPLTTIEKLNDDVKLQSLPHQYDKKQPRELLQVIGKDMRVIVFAFRPRTKQKNEVFDALRRYTKPAQLWDLYAFSCDPSTVKKSDPKSRLLKEYHRLFTKRVAPALGSGFEVEKDSTRDNLWRLTTVNSSYSLCSTYPSQLIVPRSISDEDLWQASSFRAGRRLPIISWCDPGSGAVLARSSQPLVGLMMNFRNNADEKLVSALCPPTFDAKGPLSSSASSVNRKQYIVDARPRANALANGAKGGGSESSSNYPKSEVLFLGIQNIHTMRDSLSRLRDYVDAHGSISSNGTSSAVSLVGDRRNRGSTWGGGSLNSMTQFSSMLGEWLNHIQNILVGASWIAAQIAQESASVLVHCSDGWDRTTQLIALACLLLDPHYRTFSGFQALVEKDWLAFGHPFAERMGIPTVTENGGSQYELLRQPSLGNLSSSPSRTSLGPPGASSNTSAQSQTSNNSSPILLQWLDCIAQLLRLYPSAFEFSSKFLVDFVDCVLSCRFGNFLCNSELEREQSGVTSSCHCMWTYLADLRGLPEKQIEMPNERELTCGICFESCPRESMSAASCGHPFCGVCWRGYISTAINDGPGCLTLRCPDPSCAAAVGQDMVNLLASDEDKGKYERYLCRSYIEDNRKTKWCPAPGCEYAVEFIVGGGSYDVSCSCSYGFCWNCTEEAHRPVDCSTVSKWVLKNSAESENMNWILANSKPCPKCKRPIEKNQGCMHITCTPPCKFEFCWLCLGPWSDHGERTGGFYACNRYEAARQEGAFDDSERRREMAKNSLERYTHYYERWAANQSSRQKALGDLQSLQNDKLEKLSDIQSQPESQLKFIIEAWLQIVECRRVLKWTYAYGYYLPDNEHAKRQFFEYLQGEAESGLERLHQCAEKELQIFLDADCPSRDFNDFRTKLAGLTSVTRNYFENLVRALESGLNDVGPHSGHGATSKAVSSKSLGSKSKSGKNKAPASKSGSSTRGMDDGNIWACDQCTFANPRSARTCQVCDHQQHR